MIENYEVYQNGRAVGTVQMNRRDLFYYIRCLCRPEKPGMYRLAAETNTGRTDLGICVPMGECFGVETRVSCKRFGEGKPEFQLLQNRAEPSHHFYPVDPKKPFHHISSLKYGIFGRQNGHAGVILRDSEGNN